MNGRELGRQIGRAMVAAQLQADLERAAARCVAHLAVVEMMAGPLHELAAAWAGGTVHTAHGSFATGGFVGSRQ